MIAIETRLRVCAKLSLAAIACVVGLVCGSGAIEVVHAPASDVVPPAQVVATIPHGPPFPRLAARGDKVAPPPKPPAPIWAGVAEVTAYTACDDAGMRCDGITAMGTQARAYATVAAWSAIPFGSRVEIENVGTFIVEDRGGAIGVGRIDVYVGFSAKDEAFAFGRRQANVKIYAPSNATDK